VTDADQAGVAIRAARPGDEAEIHRMVVELAIYENAADEVGATPHDLAAALFAQQPQCFCLVADSRPRTDATVADVAAAERELAGFALWYVTYSTWTGRHGIWVEDLYVRERRRGQGIGRALLAELAAECERREYRRLEWWVLDWNSPALRFYESLGATPMSEWTVQRLDVAPLARLAAEAGRRAGQR
jgi:GNAT superfamily N-acetyltransferase